MRSPRKRPKQNDPLLQPIWCGICHVRIAPYEMAVRVMQNIYHSRCLDHLRHKSR
jgi:hypothetical protein